MLRISPVEVRRITPVEVRRGPLRSRASSWGPVRPTAIKCWQKRSGEAHCDQELADEIRRGPLRSRAGSGGPLRSRAGSGGPAKPTAIKSCQRRSGEAPCYRELAVEIRRGGEEGREEEEAEEKEAGIKSNNPHLAGGEQSNVLHYPFLVFVPYFFGIIQFWKTYGPEKSHGDKLHLSP